MRMRRSRSGEFEIPRANTVVRGGGDGFSHQARNRSTCLDPPSNSVVADNPNQQFFFPDFL